VRKKVFALIFLTVLTATATCFVCAAAAQGNETETPTQTTSFEPIYNIFKSVGYAAPVAVLVGLATCLLGYAKQTPPQNFSLTEFIYTALISLFIGIATIYGGWSYMIIDQWLGNGCLTIWIYWIAKITAKKLNFPTMATGPPT